MIMINKIIIVTLILSFLSSCIGSFFLATQNFIYRHTSAKFVVLLNKLVLCCFITPIFLIKGLWSGWVQEQIGYHVVVEVQRGSIKETIYTTKDMIHFEEIISVVWVIGIICYLLIQTFVFISFLTHIKKDSKLILQGIWYHTFQKFCKQKGLKQIYLLSSSNLHQPSTTMDSKNIYLFVPEYLLDTLEEKYVAMILNHELTHIKNNHISFQILATVLNAFHWFNPLFYVLKENLSEWIEISCDEEATFYLGEEYKKDYIDLLVRLNAEQTKIQKCKIAFCFSNSKNLKILKKRTWCIMRKRTLGKKCTRIAVLACFLGAVHVGNVLATELDKPMSEFFAVDAGVFYTDEITWVDPSEDTDNRYVFIDFDDSAFETENNIIFEQGDNITYEILFEDGTVKNITENTDMEVIHEHSFVKTNLKKHIKNSDGSCVIYTYAGKVCTECGKEIYGDFLSKVTYEPCTH